MTGSYGLFVISGLDMIIGLTLAFLPVGRVRAAARRGHPRARRDYSRYVGAVAFWLAVPLLLGMIAMPLLYGWGLFIAFAWVGVTLPARLALVGRLAYEACRAHDPAQPTQCLWRPA